MRVEIEIFLEGDSAVRTVILLSDRITGGGEPVRANVRSDHNNVYVDIEEKAMLTIQVPRDVVLGVIENEEHG